MTAIFLIYSLLLPFLFAFYLANMRRMLSVRGTRQRYVYASLCRVLQYPAIGFPLFGMLYHIGGPDFYFLPLDFFTLYFVVRVARDFRRDDDEDFWSKLKKSMKKAGDKLRARARSLVPDLSPAPSPI